MDNGLFTHLHWTLKESFTQEFMIAVPINGIFQKLKLTNQPWWAAEWQKSWLLEKETWVHGIQLQHTAFLLEFSWTSQRSVPAWVKLKLWDQWSKTIFTLTQQGSSSSSMTLYSQYSKALGLLHVFVHQMMPSLFLLVQLWSIIRLISCLSC